MIINFFQVKLKNKEQIKNFLLPCRVIHDKSNWGIKMKYYEIIKKYKHI